ncbi:SDR family oxidoreductase [Methanolobus sp. ZRKC5]|uniref:NAD-dependent epimerase/dehydratase family protein n=1 Tax=unclassified Methanolobus TaxID=2629569 RepID=UPI00313D82B2
MKVMVTGHNGYIGSVLCEMLIKEGYSVVGFDTNYYSECTLFDYKNDIEEINKDIRDVDANDLKEIDAIIHLAALSNDPMGALDEKLTEDINYRSTIKLAETAKKVGVRRFLYSSSCSMYGVADGKALNESSPLNPVTAYAKSKVDSELSLAKIADDKFSPVYLRNSTAYGLSPKMRFDLVLNNFVGWAYTTSSIKIMSDGTPWRPLAHIRDISAAFIAALDAPIENIHNQAFNVGSNSENYQIKDVAEIVKKIVPNCEITYTNEHGSDSRTYNVNFDKIKEHMPSFKPEWNVKKGAKEIYDALRKNEVSFEEFNGDKYTRLKTLKKLMESNRIEEKLYWT